MEENGTDVWSVPFFIIPLRPKDKFEYKEDEVEKKSSSARNFQHAEIL